MFQVSLIDVPNKDHVKVIYLAGEVDGDSVDSFKEKLGGVITSAQGAKYFIFHLRKLDFINSMVIGFLADTYTQLAKDNIKILLAEGNQHILDILDLVGFTNLVEHYDSLKDAINSTDL